MNLDIKPDDELSLVIFKLAIVAMLSSFMLLSAVSFFRFRLKKKERDFERIMRVLGLHEDNAAVFSPTIKNESLGSRLPSPRRVRDRRLPRWLWFRVLRSRARHGPHRQTESALERHLLRSERG